MIVELETFIAMHAKNINLLYFLHYFIYHHLHQMSLNKISQYNITNEKIIEYFILFNVVSFLIMISIIVFNVLIKKISKALLISSNDIDTSKLLHVYAMNLLLMIELQNWFAKKFNIDIMIFDIMRIMIFKTVIIIMMKKNELKMQWN